MTINQTPTETIKVEAPKVLSLYERIEASPEASFSEIAHSNLDRLSGASTLELLVDSIDQLIERIEKGSRWLDSVKADWAQNIKPDILYLGSCETCILCQTFGGTFSGNLDRLRLQLSEAVALGFHPGEPASKTDPISRALTIIWLCKIKLALPATP
jgi:hypothetical protein